MKKNNNMKFLVIIIVSILLLVLLLSLASKLVNSATEDKGDIITDKVINESVELSKEDKEKINKYDVYMENTYINSLSVEQRKSLIDLIDQVLNALNERNYEMLYSKLNYIYVDAMFPTQQRFEEYMKSITYDVSDYTCTYYNAEYYGYECLFTSESLGTRIELKISPKNDFSDYELSLRKDLIEVNERLTTFYANGISGIIEHEFVCKDTLEYSATITNTTKKAITCSFEESTAIRNLRGTELQHKLNSPTESLNLGAGESKEITFVFDVESTEEIRPAYLSISCKIGEKIDTDRVYIDNSEDDMGL